MLNIIKIFAQKIIKIYFYFYLFLYREKEEMKLFYRIALRIQAHMFLIFIIYLIFLTITGTTALIVRIFINEHIYFISDTFIVNWYDPFLAIFGICLAVLVAKLYFKFNSR